MRILIIFLSVLGLMLCKESTAQCDYSTGPVSFTASGYNATSTHTQMYFLTDASGTIIAISDTPSFPAVADGNYTAYAINYYTADGIPSGFSLGSNLASITEDDCVDLSPPLPFDVCGVALTLCEEVPGDISLNSSGFNADPGFTQMYALCSSSGQILDIQSSPDFSAVAEGEYLVYAINYEDAEGIGNLSVSNNIAAVTGGCIDFANPYRLAVCPPPVLWMCEGVAPDIQIQSVPGSYNDASNFSHVYVAIVESGGASMTPPHADGEIIAINTTGDFSGLPQGSYALYAVNYENIESLATGGLTVGAIWPGAPNPLFSCSDVDGPILALVEPITACILPLEILHFRGVSMDTYNLLSWDLKIDKHITSCILERSKDGKSFEALSAIQIIEDKQSYSYTDNNPFVGVNYYRLKFKESGSPNEFYSKTIALFRVSDDQSENPYQITVGPNPTSSTVQIHAWAEINEEISYTLYDSYGRILIDKTKIMNIGGNTFHLVLREYPSAPYILKIKIKEKTYVHKVVKI